MSVRIPRLVKMVRGVIGDNPASSSFCERLNSAAKKIQTTSCTRIGVDLIIMEQLAVVAGVDHIAAVAVVAGVGVVLPMRYWWLVVLLLMLCHCCL
jgi:hypothetical protein